MSFRLYSYFISLILIDCLVYNANFSTITAKQMYVVVFF